MRCAFSSNDCSASPMKRTKHIEKIIVATVARNRDHRRDDIDHVYTNGQIPPRRSGAVSSIHFRGRAGYFPEWRDRPSPLSCRRRWEDRLPSQTAWASPVADGSTRCSRPICYRASRRPARCCPPISSTRKMNSRTVFQTHARTYARRAATRARTTRIVRTQKTTVLYHLCKRLAPYRGARRRDDADRQTGSGKNVPYGSRQPIGPYRCLRPSRSRVSFDRCGFGWHGGRR